jgi:hypothetical protein
MTTVLEGVACFPGSPGGSLRAVTLRQSTSDGLESVSGGALHPQWVVTPLAVRGPGWPSDASKVAADAASDAVASSTAAELPPGGENECADELAR